MSSAESARRLAAGSVLAAVISIALTAPPASAGNRVEVGDRTITITIPIDVVGGTPELVDRWGPAITQKWNNIPGGEPWRWCGKEVIITTDMRPIASGEQTRRGSHRVFALAAPRPGQFFWGPTVWDPGTAYSSGIGVMYWPTPPDSRLYPTGVDRDAWERNYDDYIGTLAGTFLGAPAEDPRPDPAAEYVVDQSTIDQIAEHHNLDDEIDCRLRARHEVEWTTDGVVVGSVRQNVTLAVAFDLELEEVGGGGLRGRAEGSARIQGTSTAVGYECSFENRGGREYSFAVEGRRDGDRVELRLKPGLETTILVNPTACPNATYTPHREDIRIPYLQTLEGVLVDGRFEQTTPRRSHTIGRIPGSVVYTVEIFEPNR